MPLYYLDTSALLKRYKTEKGTPVIDALFSSRKPGEVFVTSHFTSVEVESVAARALKGRVLTAEACGVLLRLYAEDLNEQTIVMPVSTALLSEAAKAAQRNALRAGDAVHLASALRISEPSHLADLVFVTPNTKMQWKPSIKSGLSRGRQASSAAPEARALSQSAKSALIRVIRD